MNESFNIYCTQCKTIPFIQINVEENILKIRTSCLCEKKKSMSIDQLINEIKKNVYQNYQCCVCNGKEKIQFCVQCSKWFCQKCRKTHDELLSQDFLIADIFEGGNKNYINKHFFINQQINLVSFCTNHKKIVGNTLCLHCSKFFCKFYPKEHKDSRISFFKKFFLQIKDIKNQKPEDILENINNYLNDYFKNFRKVYSQFKKDEMQQIERRIKEETKKIDLINKDLIYLSNLIIQDYLYMKQLHVINNNLINNYTLITSYTDYKNIIYEDNYLDTINKCTLIPIKQVKKLNIVKKTKGKINCIFQLDSFIFLIGLGNLILILDTKNEIIKELKSTEIKVINSICTTENDSVRYLACGGNSKKIIVYKLLQDLSIKSYCKFTQDKAYTKYLINLDNGKILSLYNNLELYIWDCHQRKIEMNCSLVKINLTLSDNLPFVFSCVQKEYCVFGLGNVIKSKQICGFGCSLFELTNKNSSGYFTCFSVVDNEKVASGSSDGIIRLWTVSDLANQQFHKHQTSILNIVCFSSSIILSGDVNLNFLLWKKDFTVIKEFKLQYNITNFVKSERLGLLSYYNTETGFEIRSQPLSE